MNDPGCLPQLVERAVQERLDACGFGDAASPDTIAVLRRLGVDVTNAPLAAGDFLGLLEWKPWPTVAIHAKLAGNPFAQRIVAAHELSHYVLGTSGLGTTKLSFLTSPHLQHATEEILTDHVGRRILFNPPAFREAMARGLSNWETAKEFDVPLDAPVLRAVESVCSPFTRDDHAELNQIIDFLGRSKSRVRILADPNLQRWIDTDPQIMPDELLATPSIQALQTMIETVHDPQIIIDTLKRLATSDVWSVFDQTPVATSARLIRLLRGLSPVALSYFFLKLGHAAKTLEVLKDVRFDTRAEEAEAYCIRARAAMLLDTGRKGLDRADHLLHLALKQDPDSIEALTTLGSVKVKQGWPKQADKYLKRARDTRRDHVRVAYYLGQRAAADKNFEQAKDLYEIVWLTDGHPYRKKAGAQLADLLARDDWPAAKRMYGKLFLDFPYDVKALRTCIGHLLERGERAAATGQLIRLMRCAPLQSWCYQLLGDTYAAEGNRDYADYMWLLATLLKRAMKPGVH